MGGWICVVADDEGREEASVAAAAAAPSFSEEALSVVEKEPLSMEGSASWGRRWERSMREVSNVVLRDGWVIMPLCVLRDWDERPKCHCLEEAKWMETFRRYAY